MENKEQQILSEIKSMMASIRIQLERLDAKMAELQQVVDPEDFDAEPIDIEIDIDAVAGSERIVGQELAVEQEFVTSLAEDDDLPGVFDEPEVVTVADKVVDCVKPTINDSLASDHAWRKDMPGSPVRDIRSAISLNDRVIFINLLFNEDAQSFVDALTRINAMETLDQVVDYICTDFPSWDLNSDLVYRFMMAVRRKVK